MKIDTGINEQNRKEIAQGLKQFLADSYTLYLKTHNFHWNVVGPMFNTLHLLFENLYVDLSNAVDEIAERIRALGFHAPASYADFLKLTHIKEAVGDKPIQATDMIKQLVTDQEIIIHTARHLFAKVEEAQDQATLDLLTRRIEIHEKNAWMLRSHLE